MAKDCLLKKYKASVDSDDLEYLDFIKLYATSDNKGLLGFALMEAGVIRVLHGTINGETELTIPSSAIDQPKYITNLGTVSVDPNYDCITILIPRYTVTSLYFAGKSQFRTIINMDDYVKSRELKLINTQGYSDVTYNPDVVGRLTHLSLANSTTSILNEWDVTELGANGLLSYFSMAGVTSGNLKGSLDKLGMSALSTISAPATKEVSLSIENLVAKNRVAGRTTGSISLPWVGGCNCTFNGSPVANQQNNSLSWDATTITFNGTTITA